jgi:hypothetical protein
MGLLVAAALAAAYLNAGPFGLKPLQMDEDLPTYGRALGANLPFVMMGAVIAAALVLSQ